MSRGLGDVYKRQDTEDAQEAQKWELLQEFLAQNAYEMKLDNGTYQIYE